MAITAVTDISNLAHDYDVHADGGSVGVGIATLTDQIGSDDLTQATGADQPLYQQDGNGWGYAEFDGTSDILRDAFTSAIAQPYTIVFVVRMRATDTGHIYDNSSGGAGPILSKQGGTTLQIYAGSFVGSLSYVVDTLHIDQAVFSGASSVHRIDATESGAVNAGTGSVSGMSIGGDRNAGREAIDAYRLLIYSKALSSTERTDLYDYLNTLYSSAPPGGATPNRRRRFLCGAAA